MDIRIDKLIFILNHKLHAELNLQYKQLGLSDKNYLYLEKIAENPGVNQAFFIKEFHRDQSIVTRQINELVANGWVKKRLATTDHRRSELYLTPKGQQALPAIKAVYRQVITDVLSSLTPQEANSFALLLEKVTQTYRPVSDKHTPTA